MNASQKQGRLRGSPLSRAPCCLRRGRRPNIPHRRGGQLCPPLFSCFPFQNMLQWRKTAREGAPVADLNTDIRYHQGRGRGPRQGAGKAARPHPGRPDRLLSPPLGGPHAAATPSATCRRGSTPAARAMLASRPHRPPHPRRPHASCRHPCRGRGAATLDVAFFHQEYRQKQPSIGVRSYIFYGKSRGRRRPPPDGQSLCWSRRAAST